MPPKGKSKMDKLNSQGKKDDTKSRCGFNILKDIMLLKSSIQHNPWQLGKDKWITIAQELQESFGYSITDRTVKDRVNLLLKKYTDQQLITKTGTEEEQSERGSLLEEIAALVAESDSSINVELGAEDDEFTKFEDDFNSNHFEPQAKMKPAEVHKEKRAADKERDEALAAMCNDSTPEPSGQRRKRMRLNPEDELIKIKQDHEMKMDSKRLEKEETAMAKNFEIESQKLELERAKLELEQSREKRLTEESKRKDEIALSQLQFQNQMLDFMMKMCNTNK